MTIEKRCSTLPPFSILQVQIENGSNDDLLSQQSYTSATKMSPWPPKMATGKTFCRRQWISLLVQWVKGKALLTLTSKDGQVTLAFSTTLGHPLKTPPATSPDALAPGPSASEPSDSLTPSSGPPTPCRTSRSLLDLQILA